MYVSPDVRSKKQLRDLVAAGQPVQVYSPGPFPAPVNGTTAVEGPHYPKPHTWYAQVQVKDGLVVEVIA